MSRGVPPRRTLHHNDHSGDCSRVNDSDSDEQDDSVERAPSACVMPPSCQRTPSPTHIISAGSHPPGRARPTPYNISHLTPCNIVGDYLPNGP